MQRKAFQKQEPHGEPSRKPLSMWLAVSARGPLKAPAACKCGGGPVRRRGLPARRRKPSKVKACPNLADSERRPGREQACATDTSHNAPQSRHVESSVQQSWTTERKNDA